MEDALRVGIAAFNAGDHRVAEEAWAAASPLDDASDQRLLRGLAEYAAAVHRARDRDWRGARRTAGTAVESLAGLDADTRVNVGDVREHLRRLAVDPESAERRRPPPLRDGGDALTPIDLSFSNAATAATLLAAEHDGVDASVVADAIRYARSELDGKAARGRNDDDDAGSSAEAAPNSDGRDRARRRSQHRNPGFAGMVFDLADDRDRRSLVYDRLRAHVERRRAVERDASELFE